MITMHDIIIVIKSLLIVSICWLTEHALIGLATLSIVGPQIKDFLIEFKEIINVIVSLLVLVLTIFKIRNEKKKK